MNAAATLDYLRALGAELRPGRKFELDSMRRLLQALDAPQDSFTSVHIAGTNGKGSVAALIASASAAAGRRTGLYTSPHLERLNERIQISGIAIADDRLAEAATAVAGAAEALLARGELQQPPAFFEFMTAAGFWTFRRAEVELGVIEVGLGGRLDATNVLQPRLAVITPIGMDHEQYLGSTLAAIAAEKAGIIKPGLERVLSAAQTPDAAAVLRAHAQQAGVPLEMVAESDIAAAPPTPLPGRHQRENAALAARACQYLDLPPDAITAGFATLSWPGRLERIATDPDIYLDGAHNPLAARALAAYLDEFAQTHPAPVLIYGSMRDKAVEEICELLLPRASAVVVTAPRHPRALSPQVLASVCAPWARALSTAPAYPEAAAAAAALAAGGRAIFVTGSLYLVGEARAWHRQRAAATHSTEAPDVR
ncbi:MAG: bifunctional folylpolyglutamate synthase/dihydrofolate synthase [Terriglobales bacterium]